MKVDKSTVSLFPAAAVTYVSSADHIAVQVAPPSAEAYNPNTSSESRELAEDEFHPKTPTSKLASQGPQEDRSKLGVINQSLIDDP